MNTKLVSIFAVAGVVAAGSSAYAINAQSLKSETTSKVGTSTMDLNDNPVIIPPTDNPDGTSSSDVTGDQSADGSASGSTETGLPTGTDNSGIDDPTSVDSGDYNFAPSSNPTKKKPAPDATSASNETPALPSPPPGFKLGSGDDDDDDYDEDDEDDDRYEDHDDEDSHDGGSSYEHDDD